MPDVKSVYPSLTAAKAAVRAWRKRYSSLKGVRFKYVPVAVGNRVMYEIVQPSRFT